MQSAQLVDASSVAHKDHICCECSRCNFLQAISTEAGKTYYQADHEGQPLRLYVRLTFLALIAKQP